MVIRDGEALPVVVVAPPPSILSTARFETRAAARRQVLVVCNRRQDGLSVVEAHFGIIFLIGPFSRSLYGCSRGVL